MYPLALQRLIAELAKLPSVGQRTASRLAFHVLRAPEQDVAALAAALKEVKERIGECRICFNLAEDELCEICKDGSRAEHTICVVEQASDVFPIERTHEFRGRYHVLGGALSPIDGVEPEDLHLKELFQRLAEGSVTELVVATNSTTTGETTALYIAEFVRQLQLKVTVSRIASGLPVGADLEYADEVTLGKAFSGRREL